MSRSAFSLVTSRLSRAISSCSGFIWPCPGNACCGSSANAFTQLRSCVGWTPKSCAACIYDTPRSLISRTASSLNSRVNFRLSMTHLRLHQSECRGRGRVQKNFAERVAEIRAQLAPDTPVEVWFQDEMRVGQKNKLTYRW